MTTKILLSLTGATMALAMALSFGSCSDEPSNFDNDFYNELASGEKDYVCSAWFGSVYVKENGSDIWTNTEQDYETDLRKKGDNIPFCAPGKNRETIYSIQTNPSIEITQGHLWFSAFFYKNSCNFDPEFAKIYEVWSKYCDETRTPADMKFYIKAPLNADKTFTYIGKTFKIEALSDKEINFSISPKASYLEKLGYDANELAKNSYKFVWKYKSTSTDKTVVDATTIGYDSFRSFLNYLIDKMDEYKHSYDVDGVTWTTEQLRQIVAENSDRWEPSNIWAFARQLRDDFEDRF